ncbi:hypothetical protein TA3x_000790 [Tundrisphaera sp. TA3]|uniref:hypothetical protein n=1 Tax=Tundrisphaera sp. TA3 TaxID=3435775 RepID=UPI003EBFB863
MRPAIDDLDWLAFLYVSDEMDDAGRAAFEDRLDRDQSAREAVAGAIGMAQVVAMAPTAASRPSPLRLPTRRLAGLAAAAGLVGASLIALRPAPAPAPDRPPIAEIVQAWSDLRGGREPGPIDAELLAVVAEPADAEVETSAAPPSWLLIAASGDGTADPTESLSQED